MARTATLVTRWNRLHGKPGGHWLFSRLVCFKAPGDGVDYAVEVAVRDTRGIEVLGAVVIMGGIESQKLKRHERV